jgi:hypothetical protein
MCVKLHGRRINVLISSCPMATSMPKFIIFAMSLCALLAELAPVDGYTGRCSHLVLSPHPWSFSFLSGCNSLAMPRYRPRGKPKRGSSWKPRRPPLTSSDSSASDVSPPRPADLGPVPLRPPQPRSMAVIPHTPTSVMRLSLIPPELPSSSMHPGEPSAKWSEPPPPQPALGEQVRATLNTWTEFSSQKALAPCMIWRSSFGERSPI